MLATWFYYNRWLFKRLIFSEKKKKRKYVKKRPKIRFKVIHIIILIVDTGRKILIVIFIIFHQELNLNKVFLLKLGEFFSC